MGLFVALGALGIAQFREDISFYANLYRANRVGKQFYAQYEHLARDVQFSPDMTPRLDVYSPPEGDNYPVLLFVHGGGWDKYDKELFAPVAKQLLPQGMVVVIPNYTLYPDAGYEQMASEVAAALSWTLENIDRYGGDPTRVTIAGHSAGGHLAGLVVLDEHFLQAFDHRTDEVCGFVGLSGVYDVNAQFAFEQSKGSDAPVMTAVMGGRDNFEKASPISYITPFAPPALLIHGEQDTTVPASMSQAFHEALQSAGALSELRLYPDKAHSDYLFDALVDEQAPIIQELTRFVTGCLPPVG